MYAWIPRTIDAVVPFLIGAGEGLMIAALQAPVRDFLLIYTATIAVGVVAAANYARHAAKAELQTTSQSQQIIAIHPKALLWLDSLGLVCATALTVFAFSSLPQPHPAVLAWSAAAVFSVLLASHHWRWTLPMRRRPVS